MVVRWMMATALSIAAVPVSAATLTVGPGGRYTLPSEAAAAAHDGDVVEIRAGDYAGDVAVWRQSRLTIRAVGGRVRLNSGGKTAEDKAIWVTRGDEVRIIGITFEGARSSGANGAGIRHEGGDLGVIGCVFRNNENGILTGDLPDSDIRVESTEFDHNGAGDGQSHNVYIGRVASFTLRFSYSHNANVGHAVKSRARRNLIAYNVIADLRDGRASYLVDLPDAGGSLVMGNVLQRGPAAENSTMLSYGAEGKRNPDHALFVVNNTFVALDRPAVFVANKGEVPALVANNIFQGAGEVVQGPADARSNLHFLALSAVQTLKRLVSGKGAPADGASAGFVFPEGFDFHLRPDSPAVDAGTALGEADGFDLTPRQEYLHPLRGVPRPANGAIDLGAFELRE